MAGDESDSVLRDILPTLIMIGGQSLAIYLLFSVALSGAQNLTACIGCYSQLRIWAFWVDGHKSENEYQQWRVKYIFGNN